MKSIMDFISKHRWLACIIKPKVKPGEIYQFRDNYNDPFDDDGYKVNVVAVKNGYVRYEYSEYGTLTTIKHSDFSFCFMKIEEVSS